jgi:hypothetical protein
MERIPKIGYSRIIAQLHSIHVVETHYVHPDLQYILSRDHLIFTTSQELPPSCGVHDHYIPLISGSLPPNVQPYLHPFAQKSEIEKKIHELLEVGGICPSTSPYSSHVVMVLNK